MQATKTNLHHNAFLKYLDLYDKRMQVYVKFVYNIHKWMLRSKSNILHIISI